MNKKNKKENDGIEIIPPEINEKTSIEASSDNDSVSIKKDHLKVKKTGNLVIGNVNMSLNSARSNGRNYYQKNIWHLVANIFLLFLIILLITFLLLSLRKSHGETISLKTINNNESIVAGSLNSFSFNYRANNDLTESSVSIFLPENFKLESVSPKNLFEVETNTFKLGDLKPGFNGEIKINGFVFGERNDQQLISFHFNCNECPRDGLSSTLSYNIDKMVLEAKIDISDPLYLNSESEASLFLKNNSEKNIENIKIGLGPDLEITKSTLKIEENYLFLDEIRGGEELKIDFHFIARKKGELNVNTSLNFKLLDNDFSFQGEEKKISVKESGLDFSILTSQDVVKKNDNINYTIRCQNKEKESIRNISITFYSANPNFSLSSITAMSEINNGHIEGKTISIYNLLEGESVNIDLSTIFERRQVRSGQEIFLGAEIRYEIGGQSLSHRLSSNKSKLISEISASARAYYYSPQGDQLGVGPMPPAVDMKTSYWVFLDFNNIGNSLEDFVLTAELAENVYLTGNRRVLDGFLIYGDIGKKLVWEIENISGGSNNYQASFEISLMPEEKHLGKVLDLVRNIKITARDSFANKNLELNLANINTNLENDRLSAGKGRVISIR
jgi:hypothetical protein